MRRVFLLTATPLLASGLVLAACSDSNEPEAEDHTPVRIEATVNGGAVITDDTLRLTAAAGTDLVRLTFYNAADENLDAHEDDHFSLLTFTPAAGITATVTPDHHFQHDIEVTAPAGTAGDVEVGYGHHAAADEHTFTLHFKVE
jgi:hypothetical protein